METGLAHLTSEALALIRLDNNLDRSGLRVLLMHLYSFKSFHCYIYWMLKLDFYHMFVDMMNMVKGWFSSILNLFKLVK
jgi:hypothetical protein